jgi:glyoxylase-like metal-dependent hydrolase (beta-lactamase superfamily II)
VAKAFASQDDLADKTITFAEIGAGLYAFTAEGDPNSGVIIGDDSVMVIEAQATPRLVQKVTGCIRSVTDKPISHVVLTHCHAVRVLGASLNEAWDAVRAACDPKFGDYAIYEHCLPFNVARAYDEARGILYPRIWTAQCDLDMWAALQR